MSLARLGQFINNLERLQPTLSLSIEIAMESNSKKIEERQQERLLKGFDFQGKSLKHRRSGGDRPYTKEYEKHKTRVTGNSSFTNVDLNLTGEFYKSIKQKKVGLSSYTMTSDDQKYGRLQHNYTDDILGYTDSDQEFIVQTVLVPTINQTTNSLLKV